LSFNRESAVEKAKADLAHRLGLKPSEIAVESVAESDFPDASLGAPTKGEMSAQIISSGWLIKLRAKGKKFEYRADKYQLRLRGFKGTNYLVKS
jgi:hypothetical protein